MKIKNYIEYIIIVSFAGFIQFIGLKYARKLAKILGLFFYYVIPIRKKLVLQNIKKAFPEKPNSEVETIARNNFINVITMLFEIMSIPKLNSEDLQRILVSDKWNLIKEKYKMGKGMILMTAHFGNWELAAVALGANANVPIYGLAKPQRNEMVFNWINDIRTSFGNRLIIVGSSVREALQVLESGGCIGIVGDQRGHVNSIRVKYFGVNTAVHSGAGLMAVKSNSPIVVVFMVRQPNGNYFLEVEEIDIRDCEGEESDKIIQISQKYMDLLEKMVKIYPDHWFWMHNIWKY